MLRAETVAPATLDLIKRLFQDKTFDEFLLVGGTALSLQIGHRISVDIDLFNDRPFDSEKISNYLASHYKAESIQTLKNGVFCFIEDIKVDMISHQYPWIKKFITNIEEKNELEGRLSYLFEMEIFWNDIITSL